jgi:cysteinyl-tRNA synthetase
MNNKGKMKRLERDLFAAREYARLLEGAATFDEAEKQRLRENSAYNVAQVVSLQDEAEKLREEVEAQTFISETLSDDVDSLRRIEEAARATPFWQQTHELRNALLERRGDEGHTGS